MRQTYQIDVPLPVTAEAHFGFLGCAGRAYGSVLVWDAVRSTAAGLQPVLVYQVDVGYGQGDVTALASYYFPDVPAFVVRHLGTSETIAKGQRPAAQGYMNKERA